MRRLLTLFLLLAATYSQAASLIIRGTVTVTNAPTVNGNSLGVLYIGGSTTRIYTNDPSLNTAIYIQTNSTIAGSATNLWYHLAAAPIYPSYGIAPVTSLASNAITIISSVGGPLTLSVTGNWASVTYATQTVAEPKTMIVRVPITAEPASSNQTYVASTLVQNLSDLSTNSFATNALSLTNYLSIGSTPQTTGNKTLTNSTESAGWITNALGIGGVVTRFTNGYSTNLVLDLPISTNLINYGSAISSRGSAPNSEQFGNGATASGTNSTALGRAAVASGTYATAIGAASSATGEYSAGIGDNASASGYQSISLGVGAAASGSNSIVIGASATANGFANTFVLGTSAQGTTTNDIVLGSSSHTVSIPGRLISASITNANTTGTNIFGGDASFPVYANGALANGNNASILIGTNRYMSVSGPSAAYTLNGFQGGRNGKVFILEKDDSFTMTVANDSGVDPTAANRIYTGTGGDVTVTNNPGFVEFIYNSSRSRWCLKNKSN